MQYNIFFNNLNSGLLLVKNQKFSISPSIRHDLTRNLIADSRQSKLSCTYTDIADRDLTRL